MKIIINASSIFKGGAEQVADSFINECKKIPEHEYHVLLRDNIKSNLNIKDFPENFIFYDIKKRPGSGIINLYNSLRYFDTIEKEIQPDVVISTGGHGFWRSEAPVIGGFNIPHYIYPDSPYFEQIGIKKKLFWWLKKKIDLIFYRRLDAIFVQTEDVKVRLSKLIKDIPIHVVSNTVNACFFDYEKDKRILPKRNGKEFRFLTLSAYYPHKNLDIIKEVLDILFSKSIENIKFVLTLPEDKFEKFIDKKYADNIINVGPVPINDCPILYRECDAMFLPTLLECFSASYAEAMKMEKPILTSDLGFAHTVCNKAALYFDPLDPADIVESIELLINDDSIYDRLVREGTKEFKKFNSPAERARAYIKIAENQL